MRSYSCVTGSTTKLIAGGLQWQHATVPAQLAMLIAARFPISPSSSRLPVAHVPRFLLDGRGPPIHCALVLLKPKQRLPKGAQALGEAGRRQEAHEAGGPGGNSARGVPGRAGSGRGVRETCVIR